ncbi:Hsp20/alpha crystallin family protein [Sorangium sp. So ce1078]|uniref:Hsp20/alpha crystallin family protein n=1 Tax=Sorangium sp. So ce1078 TaxID=3133329 RepID=UPI003F6126A3
MLTTYTHWLTNDPWDTPSAMSRALDAAWRWPVQTAAPSADVLERDDAWEIVCDVPGMGPEDIQVAAEHGVITIRGGRRWDGGSSEFVRSFWLGDAPPSADVSASLANGVLRVRVLRRAASEGRVIPVRAGGASAGSEGAGGGVLRRIREGFSRSGRALARVFRPARSAGSSAA